MKDWPGMGHVSNPVNGDRVGGWKLTAPGDPRGTKDWLPEEEGAVGRQNNICSSIYSSLC